MKVDHRTVTALRRSDLARATGCNLETIRYYESIGVMPEPPRDASNYRSYDETHVARLRFVMLARDLGFSLDEVRDLLGLVGGGTQTCAEVKSVAERHLRSVRDKIADLQRIEMVLDETIGRCSGEAVPECAVIDALSEADNPLKPPDVTQA